MPAPADPLPVRLVALRPAAPGLAGGALFLFPGIGGRAIELEGLAARLPAGRAVFAVEAYDGGGGVEDMAARALAAIRAQQPEGPYALAGYSFGGMVALETAGLIREAGQGVSRLAMIETFFDRRYWPAHLFAKAQLRRAVIQLRAVAKQPINEMGATLAYRVRRLVGRLTARWRPRAQMSAAAGGGVQALCYAALPAYIPQGWTGPLMLLRAARNADFGCDCARLWAPLAPQADVRTVPGDHRDVMRDPAALEALASALAEPEVVEPPTALVVTTARWFATARLALSLHEAGFGIEAVCPPDHPLLVLPFVRHASGVTSAEGLASAVARSRPTLIVPADDVAAQRLHRVHADADDTATGRRVRATIARSLGDPQLHGLLYARSSLLAVAGRLGVVHAESDGLPDEASAVAALARLGSPLVLKSDGSWGGQGVAIVETPEATVRAWRALRGPPGWPRALKRRLIDGDDSLLALRLAGGVGAISGQRFIDGRPGTLTAACRDGQVLAAICCEALRTSHATGPATVVRVIDHPEMLDAARRLAGELKLSGLFGLDFMLDAATGEARLIELNPRATPTAHLRTADGRSLAAALFAAATGTAEPRARRAPSQNDIVALFPQEWARDRSSPFLAAACDDIPRQSPELMALGEAMLAGRPATAGASGAPHPLNWSVQSG